MVKLIKLLRQVIRIIGKQCRAISSSRLLHHIRQFRHRFNQILLLGGNSDIQIRLLQFGAVLGCLAQHRTDTRIRILDERPRVSVEIDGLFRIEQHSLLGVHFQDKILQCPQRHLPVDLLRFRLRITLQLAQFLRSLAGGVNHRLHQIVGIHHRSLAGFHLPFRQLHHPVRKMLDFFRPREAQFAANQRQHLKMVILLVAYHINHLVHVELVETLIGSADVLRHID